MNESAGKLGKVIKDSTYENENTQEIVPTEINNFRTNMRSPPNSNKFSNKMIETLGISMNNRNSLKVIRDDRARASTLGIPV